LDSGGGDDGGWWRRWRKERWILSERAVKEAIVVVIFV
jgi:hypothetical protein